jgi:hypothetical protein
MTRNPTPEEIHEQMAPLVGQRYEVLADWELQPVEDDTK